MLGTPYTEAQSSAIQANDLPKVLDMTGSAELSTRIDTQFPMIYRKGDRAVTQGRQDACTQGHEVPSDEATLMKAFTVDLREH